MYIMFIIVLNDNRGKEMSRFYQVMSVAKNVISNPHLMRHHMWKTTPCCFGVGCKRNFQECAGAHFIEEYRAPMCLYLEFCEDLNCDKYHPHMGTLNQYIIYKGICLLPYDKWFNKKNRYDEAQRNFKELMLNPDTLKKHLYKTRKCFNGIDCKMKDKCVGAHFFSEYRLPMCVKDEFCTDYKKGCKNYHSTFESKEEYMKSQGISFEHNTYEEYASLSSMTLGIFLSKDVSLLLPLKDRVDVFSQGINKVNPKAFTQLCSMVKDDQMCNKFGCTFAHTVDQLRGYIKDSFDIPDYYKRPIHKNSLYDKMIFEQNQMIEKIGNEDEEDEDYTYKLDFLTQEETEEEQFFFELDFNPKFMEKHENGENGNDEYEYEEYIRIDIPSISKIIEFEKLGILKDNSV